MYYVYILICGDGTYYTGYAADLEARVQKHNRGEASKYTRSRFPVRLAYHEVWPDKSSAMRRERAIKKMTRQAKMELVHSAAAGTAAGTTGVLLVSACLAGEKCRYNGGGFDYPRLRRLVAAGRAVPVCPEVLGGAPVPRDPCEIRGGDGFKVLDGTARVFSARGKDVTGLFLQGAEQAVALARRHRATAAVCKERSPSCGVSTIYDGTFGGVRIPGCGCATAALRRAGLQIYSEENMEALVGRH